MKYDKLVRDKIHGRIKEKGAIPITHTADAAEYSRRLKEKLQEEVSEYLEDENLEELADILEVIYAICKSRKIGRKKLEEARKNKYAERGGFRDRTILEDIKEPGSL